MTLKNRIERLFQLFGLRNAMYLRGDQRALFLLDAVRSFGKLIRNGETNKARLARSLASVFGRACSFADSYVNLPITEALCQKYPLGRCAYCQEVKCVCDPRRKKSITHASISAFQLEWSVGEWCRGLNEVYGEVNLERGVSYAVGRLNEEVGEVISAQLLDAQDRRLTLTDVRKNISREFADVFAWIFTLAALLNIDLEVALDQYYPAVHRRCGTSPCDCGPYYYYLTEDTAGGVSAEARTMVAE